MDLDARAIVKVLHVAALCRRAHLVVIRHAVDGSFVRVSILRLADRANNDVILFIPVAEAVVVDVARGPARLVQELLRVEGAGLALGTHLGDVLIVDVLEVRHLRDIIVESAIISLDHIRGAFLMLLTVSLTERIFLRCYVAILSQSDADEDENEDDYVKNTDESEDHIWRRLKKWFAHLQVDHASQTG